MALYVHPDKTPGGILSVPIYHWTAPFANPRGLREASFYLEGEFLGTQMEGFREMLREIERTRPKQVFILGSLYDRDSGFGPLEAPYEDQQGLLDSVASKAGTEILYASELP